MSKLSHRLACHRIGTVVPSGAVTTHTGCLDLAGECHGLSTTQVFPASEVMLTGDRIRPVASSAALTRKAPLARRVVKDAGLLRFHAGNSSI